MTTKIASPQDLRAELQQIIGSLNDSGTQPSRAKLASELLALADRVAADPEANDDEFNEMLALKSYERLASFAKDGLKLAKGKGGVKSAWTLVGPSLINWLAGAAGASGDEDLSRKLKALKK